MLEISLIVGLVTGLVEVVKRTGYVDKKFSALLALFIGIAIANLFGEGDATERLFEGVVVGLMASGLYSGGKSLLK